MDVKRKQPLGIELVRRGIVNGDAIEKALQYQSEHPNKRLGDILYILKEAEMLVNSYVTRIENKENRSKKNKELKQKYEKYKGANK